MSEVPFKISHHTNSIVRAFKAYLHILSYFSFDLTFLRAYFNFSRYFLGVSHKSSLLCIWWKWSITLWRTCLRLCNSVSNLFFSCGLHNEINWSSLNPLGLSRRCMAFSSLSDFLLRNKAYHHMLTHIWHQILCHQAT